MLCPIGGSSLHFLIAMQFRTAPLIPTLSTEYLDFFRLPSQNSGKDANCESVQAVEVIEECVLGQLNNDSKGGQAICSYHADALQRFILGPGIVRPFPDHFLNVDEASILHEAFVVLEGEDGASCFRAPLLE